MDLDQLQSVRDRERASDDLQELREAFYADAAAFVGELRAERAEAAAEADDPFDSPRVNRLTDRIRTAEQTLEAIYEKRVGKVVKAATFAAAELPAEAEGMTAEEAELFETLVAEIQANREAVLGDLSAASDEIPGADAGDGDVPAANAMGSGEESLSPDAAGAPPDDGADGERGAPADDAGDSAEASADRETSDDDPEDAKDAGADDDPEAAGGGDGPPDVERQLVRITDDVGAILGVDDREYNLAEDDVVTLPAANARPLIEQGAAEPLD